jgi:hypothetical protein
VAPFAAARPTSADNRTGTRMHVPIATDGTLPTDLVVTHVERLCRTGDAVTVMTAINLPRQLLRQLDVIASAERGSSIEQIVDVCRERRVDLLVLGSTGTGRFDGRLGSTGTRLVRNATADVLLIRVPRDSP